MGTGPKGCGDRKCGCAGLRGGLAEERQTREGSGTTRRRERWQGKAGARGRGEGHTPSRFHVTGLQRLHTAGRSAATVVSSEDTAGQNR